MTIATNDQYIASVKQRVGWMRNGTVRTTVGGTWFSLFELTGQPGGGVLAGTVTGTSTPIMPTATTPGCPSLDFTSGTGYLSRVEFSNTVACRLAIFDMLSKSGNYAYNSGTSTITTPLDISSRCPDYSGVGDTAYGNNNEIWIEIVGAMTSATAWQVQVTYYNQAGNLSTSIVSIAKAAAALTVGTLFQIALASGDSGVQSIKSVIVTTGSASAGSFNVLILRPLYTTMRVPVAVGGDTHGYLQTGLPILYNTSALYVAINADSTSSGAPAVTMEIASA